MWGTDTILGKGTVWLIRSDKGRESLSADDTSELLCIVLCVVWGIVGQILAHSLKWENRGFLEKLEDNCYGVISLPDVLGDRTLS